MKFSLHELPNTDEVEKIFFVGIKGVGVAPLALIAQEAGLRVAGSDVDQEFITDKYLHKKNIPLFKEFSPADIESFFSETTSEHCLVVTTGAHKGFDNPQVVFAKSRNIPILSQGQALALFMEGEIINRTLKGISVAGSHGKTTITSLLATTMKAMGLDPSYTNGTGEVFPLGAPGYLGRGEYFIAEADEYVSEPVYDKNPKFLYQNPFCAIFNNIDFDHPDVFRSVEDVASAFEELAHNIKSGGMLFINGDDDRLTQLAKNINKDIRIITYGGKTTNDYVAAKIVTHKSITRFSVLKRGKEIGFFEIGLMGEYNARNALAVIALLTEFGYEAHKIKACIREFEGAKRRSEQVGVMERGATVIDDYGHHPLEILTTLNAIKNAHAGKKLICIFQPHTYSRTKSLLSEFASSFSAVEKVLLLPVFKSARDTETDTISQEEITKAFSEKKDTTFFESFTDVIEYVRQNYTSSEYVIITVGAGDVYKIAYELIQKK